MQLSVSDRELLHNAFYKTAAKIASLGFEYDILTDFKKVRTDIGAAGKELMPFFWEAYFQPNEQNGFCFVLKKDGIGIAYICTRLVDCGSINFNDYYTSILRAIYSHDPDAELDPDWACTPMQRINGKVAYSGDAVVHKDYRSMVRSAKVFGLISKLSLYFSVMMWSDINWVVGTISERDVSRGLAWYYGATSVYPMAEKWLTLPKGRLANYAFAVSSRDDVLYCAKAAIHRSASPTQTEHTPGS